MHNFFFRQSSLINNALPSFIALFFETSRDVLLVPYHRKRKKNLELRWNNGERKIGRGTGKNYSVFGKHVARASIDARKHGKKYRPIELKVGKMERRGRNWRGEKGRGWNDLFRKRATRLDSMKNLHTARPIFFTFRSRSSGARNGESSSPDARLEPLPSSVFKSPSLFVNLLFRRRGITR